MNAHEVLVTARNLIEREGWRSYGDPPNHSDLKGRCAVGRIYGVAGSTDLSYDASLAVARVVGEGDSASALAVWNDEPGRTKEEVLAAFDEAIRRTAPAPEDPFVGAAQGTDVVEGRAAEQVGAPS